MLGGLFSNKSTAAVFVDYEHWYYGYKNIFAMRPNVEEWYKELKEEYNVKSSNPSLVITPPFTIFT